jgi:hypothetical integral membrane protein (TIGR02206 family)
MTGTFVNFGLTHWIAIFCGLTAYFTSIWFAKKSQDQNKVEKVLKFIAYSILLFFPLHLIFYIFVLRSFNFKWDLPILQICGLVSVFLSLFIFTKKAIYFKLVYFWGLSAMLTSFLAPDLRDNFPHIFYFLFWGSHIVIISVLAFVFKLRAVKISYIDIWQAFFIFLIYVFLIYPINHILNANYGFVREIPDGNLMISFFGSFWSQSPFYFLPAGFIILALFHVLYFLRKFILSKT